MYDHFISWCYHVGWLDWFRNGKYSIPVLQSFHILGLTAVLGVVCILSIRLLGFGFRKLPLSILWNETARYFLAALTLTITAGIVIALIDPTRYLANTPFRLKMLCLLIAIIFHYTAVRATSRKPDLDSQLRTTPQRAMVGAFALLIWFSVGWAGRMIAFFM